MMKKCKKVASMLVALAMTFAMFSGAVVANAADFESFEIKDAAVELDGTNAGTVTVALTSKAAQPIFCVEGLWSVEELEGEGYFTLSAVKSTKLNLVGLNYGDAATGKLLWQDPYFMGVNLSAGDAVVEATYEIAANTPAGEYTVSYSNQNMIGSDYNNDKTAYVYEAVITVTAPEEECQHDFKWDYDEEEHWKVCECEVEEEGSRAAHVFGEWALKSEGIEARSCECGYEETQEVEDEGGEGGDGTGDSSTGDSTNGGNETGGDGTGDNTTGDSTNGGDETGGDGTGDNTTGDSTNGGDETGGDGTGDDTSTDGNTSVITPIGPSVGDATTGDTTDTTVGGSKFVDTKGHWCADLIEKWADLGVIEGLGGGEFKPDGLLTRAQAAAIFTRWLDLEVTADVSVFADVKAGDWYYDYVAKCYAAGIVKGKAADQFAPNDYITRAEMFTMLCRALNIEGQTTISKVFSDVDQIPAWAAEYTYALINNGYVSGMTETTLAPLGNVTRAQMVKLMDNLEGLAK